MNYTKTILFLSIILFLSCTNKKEIEMKPFTEKEVLDELDKAFQDSEPLRSHNFENSPYNFFLDLEPPYTIVGGSKIHLYADSINWAVVFEINGYNTRGGLPQIELTYVGNCINFDYEDAWGNSVQSNTFYVDLVTPEEIERIRNKKGNDFEQFEMVDKSINYIKIRDRKIKLINDYKEFEKLNINIQDFDNPNNLIDYGALFRYINVIDPESVSANKTDIQEHMKVDLPQIMTLENFHYIYPHPSIDKKEFYEKKEQILKDKNYNSILGRSTLPSQQELFQLIAKILVIKDTALWKPTLPANNHWSNWESGVM